MANDPELLATALRLLRGFLACPEIADCAPEDLDQDTRLLESETRKLIERLRATHVSQPDADCTEAAEIRSALESIVTTFEADELQGYHSKDRQFAISIGRKALDAALAESKVMQ